jgi:ammonium transporter, Amt family
MPLRVSEYEEALGMDTVQHGEEAYPTGEGAILVSPEAGIEEPVPVADSGLRGQPGG